MGKTRTTDAETEVEASVTTIAYCLGEIKVELSCDTLEPDILKRALKVMRRRSHDGLHTFLDMIALQGAEEESQELNLEPYSLQIAAHQVEVRVSAAARKRALSQPVFEALVGEYIYAELMGFLFAEICFGLEDETGVTVDGKRFMATNPDLSLLGDESPRRTIIEVIAIGGPFGAIRL